MRFTDIPLVRPVTTVMLLVSLMVLGTVAAFRLPLRILTWMLPKGLLLVKVVATL